MEAGWLEHILDEQARAAIRISGAETSSWDGNIDQFRSTLAIKSATGLAWPNGRIEYKIDGVEWPIRAALRRGRMLDDRGARDARAALHVILHENTHMLAPHSRPFRGYRLQRFHEVSVEEGVTDLFAHLNLDRYVRALGLDAVTPAILTAGHRPNYPGYLAMVDGLVQAASDVTGYSRRTVLGTLAVVNAQDKETQLGEMLLLGTERRVWIPNAERAVVRERLTMELLRAIDDTKPLLGDGTRGGQAPKQAGKLVRHRLLRTVQRAQVDYRDVGALVHTQEMPDRTQVSPAPISRRGRVQSRSDKIAELRRRSPARREGRNRDVDHS